ncbi:uncharacterized protein LOC135849509 isoform X3 [Planococcus citri]|uniref:uncharacterized protein LOC135849509 isoform X3 n=1 Tax=Planococcus citri TaxID=170843 RepID=UPI0031F7D7F7
MLIQCQLPVPYLLYFADIGILVSATCVSGLLTVTLCVGYLYFKIHKKMMPHSSVLLIILIAYSAHSFGVTIPYENNARIHYSYKENITISCTGTDKVAWRHIDAFWMKGNYTVIEQTPYRKILQIKNATLYHTGVYECFSINNSDDFMSLWVLPDNTCYPHNGTQFAMISPLGSHPAYITSEGTFDEPYTP